MRKFFYSLMFLFGGLASEINPPAGRPCAVPSTLAPWRRGSRPPQRH